MIVHEGVVASLRIEKDGERLRLLPTQDQGGSCAHYGPDNNRQGSRHGVSGDKYSQIL